MTGLVQTPAMPQVSWATLNKASNLSCERKNVSSLLQEAEAMQS